MWVKLFEKLFPIITPTHAPKNSAGAKTPPISPILKHITVKINFKTRSMIAKFKL